MEKAMERNTSFSQHQVSSVRKGSWMAALWTERKPEEQRKENHQNKILADDEYNLQPLRSVPFTPAAFAPNAAPRARHLRGSTAGSSGPQEAGQSCREGSGTQGHRQLWFSFHSSDLNSHTHCETSAFILFFKATLIYFLAFLSVFSHSVVTGSLRPPWTAVSQASPTPRANSCPLSWSHCCYLIDATNTLTEVWQHQNG